MAALATCHRQAGDLATSASIFEQLYHINERQSKSESGDERSEEQDGAANQSGVMLARTLSDVHKEAEQYSCVCVCDG